MKREGGIFALPEAAENLINQLHEYGLFVVKGGELESWMKDLEASGHGSGGIDIFERMGEDPNDDDYIIPKTMMFGLL